MLFDLCTRDEGNPFSTKICVVGSYTDTLLTVISPAILYIFNYDI